MILNLKDMPRERVYHILGGKRRYFSQRERKREARILWLTIEMAREPMGYGRTQELQDRLGVSSRAFSYYLNEIKRRGHCSTCGQLVASNRDVEASREEMTAEINALLADGIDLTSLLNDPALPAETDK